MGARQYTLLPRKAVQVVAARHPATRTKQQHEACLHFFRPMCQVVPDLSSGACGATSLTRYIVLKTMKL